MSSLHHAALSKNDDKENAVEGLKKEMQNNARQGVGQSVSRFKSLATLNASSRRRKTALRTKSSNSILSSGSVLSTQHTRPDLLDSFLHRTEGNYNKAQRTNRHTGPSADKENQDADRGVHKLVNLRDSPEQTRMHKVNKQAQGLRQLSGLTEESSAIDSDSELEIEFVPHYKPTDVVEIPDGYQPVSSDVLKYVFAGGSVNKKALDSFQDPLDLDLTEVEEAEKQQSSHVLDCIQNPKNSDGFDLELEFPETNEETEKTKLEGIDAFYKNIDLNADNDVAEDEPKSKGKSVHFLEI